MNNDSWREICEGIYNKGGISKSDCFTSVVNQWVHSSRIFGSVTILACIVLCLISVYLCVFKIRRLNEKSFQLLVQTFLVSVYLLTIGISLRIMSINLPDKNTNNDKLKWILSKLCHLSTIEILYIIFVMQAAISLFVIKYWSLSCKIK